MDDHSRQFGDLLVAEPVIEFIDDATTRYTLRQRNRNRSWTAFLFTILANFSREVAPIARHGDRHSPL